MDMSKSTVHQQLLQANDNEGKKEKDEDEGEDQALDEEWYILDSQLESPLSSSVSSLATITSTLHQPQQDEELASTRTTIEIEPLLTRTVQGSNIGIIENISSSDAMAATPHDPSTPAKSLGHWRRIRVWKDLREKYQTRAQFVGFHAGSIHLLKTNGVRIAVPLAKLCTSDIRVVEQLTGKVFLPFIPNSTTTTSSSASATGTTTTTTTTTCATLEYWYEFFVERAGVNIEDATTYAHTFKSENIGKDIFVDLNKDVLKELGVKIGDIIRVMKAVTEFSGYGDRPHALTNIPGPTAYPTVSNNALGSVQMSSCSSSSSSSSSNSNSSTSSSSTDGSLPQVTSESAAWEEQTSIAINPNTQGRDRDSLSQQSLQEQERQLNLSRNALHEELQQKHGQIEIQPNVENQQPLPFPPPPQVCLDSVASALIAEKTGGSRIELCAGLMEGGITPSSGLISTVKAKTTLPVMVMIRPRGGDFCYDDDEFKAMLEDIKVCHALKVEGVVFGVLLPDGSVDKTRTKQAFDMAKEPFQALEDIISIGSIQRILTSGCERSAYEGLDMLVELTKRAQDRIIILPGAGITDRNVTKIVEATGAKEVHVGAGGTRESKMEYRNPYCSMGYAISAPEYSLKVTSELKLGGMIDRF
ncbi:hypothetical protein BG004_007438 [Podila humilis]|nr:hypothetical protein BG004_007438 [Podila humilis]